MNANTYCDFPKLLSSVRTRLCYCLLAIAALSLSIISLPLPASSYSESANLNNLADCSKRIYIRDRTLIITKELQQEMNAQIPELDRQLEAQFKEFAIPMSRRLDLVYIHQGRADWKLKFTYGGYLLKTSDETIYTSAEILQLKEKFRAIARIEIAGKNYATNGSMQQLGPILHGDTGC
jgi:hypothetical protein